MKDLQVKTRSLSSLINDVNKNKFDFDHPFQRKAGQWNALMMSKLIDTAIRYYPILPILVEEYDDGRLGVIDGKQRLTIFADYFNNKFALHKTLHPIEIDGDVYEIAGKSFKEKNEKQESEKTRGRKPTKKKFLDEDVRDRLKNVEIQLYIMKNPTEEDIREIFARINSSKGLTNTQRRTVYENNELSKIIYELTNHPVFEKLSTLAQRKKDDTKDCIRQVLMLTEASDEYDFGSFRDSDINKFLVMYNDKINYDKIELVKQALNVIDESFDKIEVKKTTTPILIYSYYLVIKDSKDTEKWTQWIVNFLENYNTNEEYKQYCNGSGTASGEMVKGRLNYFRNAIHSL